MNQFLETAVENAEIDDIELEQMISIEEKKVSDFEKYQIVADGLRDNADLPDVSLEAYADILECDVDDVKNLQKQISTEVDPVTAILIGYTAGIFIGLVAAKIAAKRYEGKIKKLFDKKDKIFELAAKNISKLNDGEKEDILNDYKGVSIMYNEGANFRTVVDRNVFVSDIAQMFSKDLDIFEKAKSGKDITDFLDKVMFEHSFKSKKSGEALLGTVYADGITIFNKSLESVIISEHNAKGKLLDEIVKDLDGNISLRMAEDGLTNYLVALDNIGKMEEKVKETFKKMTKNRGDGFFKRLFGNKEEKKAIKKRFAAINNIGIKGYAGEVFYFASASIKMVNKINTVARKKEEV